MHSEANRARCSNRRWPARFGWLLLEPAQLLQQLGAQISGITSFRDRGGFALGTPSLGAPCWPSRGWFGRFVLARARVGLGVLFGSPWRSQCYDNEESALEPSRAWLPQLRCSAHHIKQARSLTRTLGQLLRVPEALALQLIHRRLCQARRWLSHDHRCCRSRVLPSWRMARTVGRF